MKRISLTQGQFAIVDSWNYEWLNLWKWYAWWNKGTKSFYAVRNGRKVDGKSYLVYMAREILGLSYGDKRYSDHIDHNTLDNRESNLRIVTNQQNQWNRNPKGYSWRKANRKYQASISVNGKDVHLGYFITPKEACNAYLKAKKVYHKIRYE